MLHGLLTSVTAFEGLLVAIHILLLSAHPVLLNPVSILVNDPPPENYQPPMPDVGGRAAQSCVYFGE